MTAAIHLGQHNRRVILVEKQAYPHHKVCGEYVSNEVLPYLAQLGVRVDDLNPARINRFLLSTTTGKSIESDLPLGGFGVSRYALDYLLYQRAIAVGVRVVQAQVTDVSFRPDAFTVTTAEGKTYHTPMVVGAYGKRSLVDRQLQRDFMQQDSPWLGVKAHYEADFPDNLVSLHNFEGGYCGLSRVENGVVNACYLANYASFKRHKNVDIFQQEVLVKNPRLYHFFSRAKPLFEKPLVISQVSFAKKQPVENHLLMCGDTAGLIHPLCGNGMAMAIHSAKLVSDLLLRYFGGAIPDRQTLENQYAAAWKTEFSSRLKAGRLLQTVLQHQSVTSVIMKGVQLVPGILPIIIKQTHGKPILME